MIFEDTRFQPWAVFGKYAARCRGDPRAIADFGLGLKSASIFSSDHNDFRIQLFVFTIDFCFEMPYSKGQHISRPR
jgi:hypothetical protein